MFNSFTFFLCYRLAVFFQIRGNDSSYIFGQIDGDGIPYLHPENPDFGDIYPGEYGTLFIQGVMKYIIRNKEGSMV